MAPIFHGAYGELPDITVLNTDLSCWQSFLDHCRTLGSKVEFTVDRRTAPIPETAQEAFDHRLADRVAMLSISLDGLVLNTYFFGVETIDMDLDPSELTEQRFQRLCDWIVLIGRRLVKNIEVQHEGGGTPILRYIVERDALEIVTLTD